MTLLDLQNQVNDLIKLDPKNESLEVMQTSPFDDPYRFDTDSLCIGDVYDVVDETGEVHASFNNDKDADDRADEEDCNVKHREVIVIGY